MVARLGEGLARVVGKGGDGLLIWLAWIDFL
jgi:hypothetical protein